MKRHCPMSMSGSLGLRHRLVATQIRILTVLRGMLQACSHNVGLCFNCDDSELRRGLQFVFGSAFE
eukprot:399942-Amphidinium_carterae.1